MSVGKIYWSFIGWILCWCERHKKKVDVLVWTSMIMRNNLL